MILKASQRAGAAQLATHLLRTDENDHVEIHELKGFMADDLAGALREIQAIAKGTRCRQFLFSLSLNPPEKETVSDRDFRAAIRAVEQQLELTGQPRAIVFHEKEGRRHAHCVWSRIDNAKMKAINLPHFKRKLQDVSRELYIQHNWRMPDGLIDRRQTDPLNFNRAEAQQAKRHDLNPKEIKALFQKCWAASDTAEAFRTALAENGFLLARGDRRGVVAIDRRGEIYSVARMTGQKTKAVKDRLGDPKQFPTIDKAKAQIAKQMTPEVQNKIDRSEAKWRQGLEAFQKKRKELVARQRTERDALRRQQEARWEKENQARTAKLRTGLMGLWDRLTGRYRRVKRQNEREAIAAYRRDQAEKQKLVQMHLAQRRDLQQQRHQTSDARQSPLKASWNDSRGCEPRPKDDPRTDQRQSPRQESVRQTKPAIDIGNRRGSDRRRGKTRRIEN